MSLYRDEHPSRDLQDSIDPVEVALNVVRDVCEIPDRTSPEDDPHMMLVRDNELRRIVHDRLMEALNAAR